MTKQDNFECNSAEEIKQAINVTRSAFKAGVTIPVEFRRQQLQQLWRLLDENEDALCEAVYKDLGKSRVETIATEIIMAKEDIHFMLENLNTWSKPEKVTPSIAHLFNSSCYILKEPKGTVLVISPWNYPIQLNFAPIAGVVAAGCTAVIKPSELSPHTSRLFAKLIDGYLDQRAYRLINGGVEETTLLLNHQWDHIFYTGNGRVARIIMQAAALHLTPVTFELGGKSPLFIDEKVDIEIAARRAAFGRLLNVGQTCVAPDFAMMTKETEKKFIPAFQKAVTEMIGENPKESSSFGRIVNRRQYDRLIALLEERESGEIVVGGETDEKELYIAPTLIKDVSREDKLMKEEIFGPIMPIVSVTGVDDAIDLMNSMDHPLALYIFSTDNQLVQKIIKSTRSGGVCVNDVVMQAAPDTGLPFGGIGPSGLGSYHGKASFDTFTHQRSVMIKSFRRVSELAQSVRYAPYTEKNLKIMRIAAESIPYFKKSFIAKHWKWIILGVAISVLIVI